MQMHTLLRLTDHRIATALPEHDGVRLDRALTLLFPDQSRSALARLVENGHVRIDTNQVRKTSHRLSAGQTVEVDFPDPAPSTIESQDLPLTILHEDDDLVVIDKPPGIVV